MDVRLLTTDTDKADGLACELLIVVLPADEARWTLPKGLLALVKDAVSAGDLALKAGRTLYVHRPVGVKASRVVLSVSGNGSAKAWFSAVQGGVAASRSSGAGTWTLMAGATFDTPSVAEQAELTVRACSESLYVYRHTKPTAEAPGAFSRLQIAVSKADAGVARAGVKRGLALAAGVELARDTANRPGNHCTPTYLADVARQLGKSHGVRVEVLDRKAVEKLKMGAFLSVARGSDEPLQFIVLRYEGAGKKDAPLVLVGKGITFDSGGISIKPAAGMDEMKFDMGGAASVLGTFRAVAELQPKINLIGLIPTCENMVNGSATKPGDVVTSMSGLTIEVLNTDAEGRLILCDALTYAERFKPAAVVDIATLTGACVVALGHQHTGLFTPDDGLAQSLCAAGQRGLDTAWRMPVDDDYAAGLKSPFADLANVGAREGGAITAALFLKRFTQNYRWAHLDIAGTAWKSGGAKGATGRPVPLLTQFVLDFVAPPVGLAATTSHSAVKRERAVKPLAKAGPVARRRAAT